MHCSILLAFLAIVENVAYGFSQRPSASWQRSAASRRGHFGVVVTPAAMPLPTATAALTPRGGATTKRTASSDSDADDAGDSLTSGPLNVLASLWGTTGVLYILAKAIKRVLPIALEPFQGTAAALSQFELGCVRKTLVGVTCHVTVALAS